MNTSTVPTITLNNGVSIPQVGLGVWQAAEGAEVETAVRSALDAGYRLIDTAAIYGNEVGVGKAIKASGLPREEIFITTKLWNANHARQDALRAFDESLQKLDCGYIDLYLIHWPLPMEGRFVAAWQTLETLYNDKRVLAIGVSNFKPHHLDVLLKESTLVPTVNQIELHPMLQQKETRDYCSQHGIAVESYSPIMRGGEVLGRVGQVRAQQGQLVVEQVQARGEIIDLSWPEQARPAVPWAYPRPYLPHEHGALLVRLDQQHDDLGRLAVLQAEVRWRSFSVEQVAQILPRFRYDQHRVQALAAVRDCISDRQHARHLSRHFAYEGARREALQILRFQRR